MDFSQRLYDFFQGHRGLPFRSMTVFNYLLEAALAGGILILLLLAVRQLFRKKLGNRLIYLAWLLVAIRLLVPMALPNPLMNQFRPTYSEDAAARPVADQIRVRFQDALSDLSWSMTEREYERAEASGMDMTDFYRDRESSAADVVQQFAAVTSYGWTGKWFLIAYGVIAGGVLIWMVGSNARFRLRMKRGRVGGLTEEEQTLYRELCQARGVKHPLPVWRVDPLPGACLVGVLRPYIALPLTMTREEMSFALAHELCHHKAHDEWWGLVRMICCVVQWFNPLVWIGTKASRTDCELACDDRVTAPMDEEQRRAYAGVLLSTAAKRSSPGLAVLATGMTMNGKRLKKRLTAIVQSRAVRRWAAAAFAAVACVTTALAFCTAESGTPALSAFSNDMDAPALSQVPDGGDYPTAQEREKWHIPESPRPSSAATEEEAVQAAYWYLTHLTDAIQVYGVSARQAGEGWYVAFADWSGYGVSQLLVGTDGQLKRFDRCILPRTDVQGDAELPENIDEAMTGHVTALATNILGASKVSGFRRLGLAQRGRDLCLDCEATVDGQACQFAFTYSGTSLMSFSRQAPEKTVVTQVDALAAFWAALPEELSPAAFEAFHTLEWDEDGASWLMTLTLSRKDLPSAVQDALEQAYGRHTCYTLRATVDGADGSISPIELVPERLTENVPADAPQGVTAVYTETYAVLGVTNLRREETLPVGVRYTIVSTLDAGPDTPEAFDHFSRYFLIRYTSPENGDEIERWIIDPEELSDRTNTTKNPVFSGDAEDWTELTYTDDTGAAYTLPMLNRSYDPQEATATDAGVTLEDGFALAVEAVNAQYGVPPEALLTYRGVYLYVTSMQDFPTPYWQFDIYLNEYEFYEIVVSAQDGEVHYIASPSEGNG